MTRAARQARVPPDQADLLAVAAPVRRLAAARLTSPADVDDVVQETLARLWEARWRLERGTLVAYGTVVARNLIASAERSRDTHRRHAHRLAEPSSDPDPVLAALAAEERVALLAALAGTRTEDRDLLLEHEVRGTGTEKIAADRGISAGAVAARLARARARLRVEHLLAFRRTGLPTPRCRPVLDAVSLGDRRRQRALGAGEHLLECPTCAALAEPLVSRRRGLTGLAPVALLLVLAGKLLAWARAHPVPATASAVGAAGAAAAVAVAAGGSPAPVPAPSPAPPPAAAPAVPASLSVGPVRLLPAGRVGSLRAHTGRTAEARGVPVESVPADEGFWVGEGRGRRVWVQLATGGESAVRVRTGQRASFSARVVAVRPDDVGRFGLSTADGAAELRTAGAYLLVDPERLQLS
jgi:RNA polymerase sigma factor (sigma-70 family)